MVKVYEKPEDGAVSLYDLNMCHNCVRPDICVVHAMVMQVGLTDFLHTKSRNLCDTNDSIWGQGHKSSNLL